MPAYKNAEPFRQRPEEFIRESLTRAGVSPFWQGSAVQWIGHCLSGNQFFISDVQTVTVKRSPLGYAARVTVKGRAKFPDAGRELPASITYTFDERRHKATVKFE